MLTLFNWLDRRALTFRLRLTGLWRRRQTRRSPARFRGELRIDADRPESLASLALPWQERDYAALDAAARTVAGQRVPNARLRAWIERPRGHSKTFDLAVQIAWMLLASPRPIEGLAAAADRDQATLLADALRRLARLNPELCGPLVFHRHVVSSGETGSRLQILSSDVGSSWGQLPDFVICDELCHWDQPDLWFSLLSSAAKKPRCFLSVLTNAGVGRDWQWEAREAARTNPAWHFSTLDGPQAPWITDDQLREQRLLLPGPVFERLWLNRWQHSDGAFVTLAEAEACRDESLAPQSRGQPGVHYVAAIDYAEKHDHTVAVLLHRTGSGIAENVAPHLIVDRLDVVVPGPDRPTPVAWVEEWIRRIAADFHHVTFVLDEYQLVGTIQQLQREFDVRRFPFRAGKGNHALALNLRSLILRQAIAWPAGCGQLPGDCGSRDDLETELASLLYRQSPSGLCRIDHKAGRHDDRAFAVGAAAVVAIESAAPDDGLAVTPPTADGDFRLF